MFWWNDFWGVDILSHCTANIWLSATSSSLLCYFRRHHNGPNQPHPTLYMIHALMHIYEGVILLNVAKSTCWRLFWIYRNGIYAFLSKIITKAHVGKVIGLGNDRGHDISVSIWQTKTNNVHSWMMSDIFTVALSIASTRCGSAVITLAVILLFLFSFVACQKRELTYSSEWCLF